MSTEADQLVTHIRALGPITPEQRAALKNWEGVAHPDTSEHRTVGPHRAWCFNDHEWCYPGILCRCCDETTVPERWRGMYAGEMLNVLRVEVEALREQFMRVTSTPPEHPMVRIYDEFLALLGGAQ